MKYWSYKTEVFRIWYGFGSWISNLILRSEILVLGICVLNLTYGTINRILSLRLLYFSRYGKLALTLEPNSGEETRSPTPNDLETIVLL